MKQIKLLIISCCFFSLIKAQIPISPELNGISAWYIDCKGVGTQTFAAAFTASLAAVKASGVKYVRIGGIGPLWEQLYNFNPVTFAIITPVTRLEYLIDEIRKADMDVIIQVSFAPSLTACPTYTPVSGYTPLGNYNMDQQATVAANLVAYFNNTLTGIYSLQQRPIIYWTIANEPDHDLGTTCLAPAGYNYSLATNASLIAAYTRTFATYMKNEYPIKIIGPEIAAFSTDINSEPNKLMESLVSSPTASPSTSIMGKISTGNGSPQYFIDILSFHHYPKNISNAADVIAEPTRTASGFAKKLNSTGLTLRKGLIEMINNSGRTINDLRLAITEYNLDLKNGPDENSNYSGVINGFDSRSFVGGQWLAETQAEAMKNSPGGGAESWVQMMAYWSVREQGTNTLNPGCGNDAIGYISGCNNNGPRPMYWHHWMMANNFKGTFYPGAVTSTQTPAPKVKTFGAQSGDRIAVMILNQEATDFTFKVKLNGTATGTTDLNISFNMAPITNTVQYLANGANGTTSATIKGNSTVLLLYNCKGYPADRYDYTQALASATASPNYSPTPVSIGTGLLGSLTSPHSDYAIGGSAVVVNMSPSTNYTYTWFGCGSVIPSSNNGSQVNLTTCSGMTTSIFTFTVTDSYGCKDVQTFTLNPTYAVANGFESYLVWVSPSNCSNSTGSARASSDCTSATTFYSWDGGAQVTSDIKTGLAAGNHTVSVFCGTQTGTYHFYVPVIQSSLPFVDAGVDKMVNRYCTTTLSAYPNNEYLGYTYQWYKGNSAVPSATTNTWSFVVWSSDNYRVKVTDNAGCVNWADVNVRSILPTCYPPIPTDVSTIPCDLQFNNQNRSMPADNYTLTESTLINKDQFIENTIVVPDGLELTIEECELGFGSGKGIIVNPGGRMAVSNVYMHPCEDSWWGGITITGTNNVGSSVAGNGTVSITGSVFKNAAFAITGNNTSSVVVEGNIFVNGTVAVSMNESENFKINNNRFHFMNTGIKTSASTASETSSELSANLFADVDTCILLNEGDNSNLDITCNNFSYEDYAIYSNNSSLKNQGSTESGPANTFSSSSTYLNHQLRHTGNPVTYYCDPSGTFTLSQAGDLSAVIVNATEDGFCPRYYQKLAKPGSESPVLAEYNLNSIQLIAYPNPFNNELTINYILPLNVLKGTVKIFEVGSGRMVFTSLLDIKQNKMLLKDINLINGVYICSVITDSGASKHFKLICIK